MCALGQTVMRWLTHDPLRPQILPHDAQAFLDAVISSFSAFGLLFSGYLLFVNPERQAEFKKVVWALLIIIPTCFFGMLVFLVLATLHVEDNKTLSASRVDSSLTAISVSIEQVIVLQSIIMLCPIGLKVLIDPPVLLLMLGTASSFVVLIQSPHISDRLAPFGVVMTLCITMAVWFLDWRNRVKFIDLVRTTSLESIWFRHFGVSK